MGYLIFDGVNDVVSQTGASGVNAGTSAYTFRVRGTINALPASGLAGLIGTSSITTANGLTITAAGALRIYTAGTNRYGSSDGLITAGVLFDFTVDHVASGGAWTITNNLTSSVVASGNFTTSTGFATLNQFGRSSSNSANYLSADMEIFEITSPSLTEVWEADLSGGTGSVLPTVSGNNNGTLVNFPTDNSQWGGFGATYTLTAQGGTYSHSGGSAGLNRGYKLEAQGSTCSYSGASADLTYNTALVYRMNALGDSYSYVGASTSLLRGFKLAANGVAYSYAGGDAALTKSGPMVYRLTALGVTYIYSGAAATLTATGVIPAANPAAFVNRAYVGGSQVVSAQVGGRMVNNAKIGGSLTNNAMVAI